MDHRRREIEQRGGYRMTRKRGAQSMFLILQVVALHVHPPITSIAFTNGNCTNVVKASTHVHLHHSYLSTMRCKTSNITDTLFVVILENKTVDYCE